jgi:hypothetical protein
VDAETQRLFDSFERCTLPVLNHEHHVRIAWYLSTRADLATVLRELPILLRAYAGSKGQAQHYHETITFAFICLVHERVARREASSWSDFASANEDLLDHSLLDRYYEKDVLESALARRVFVLPAPGRAGQGNARPGDIA